MNRFVEIALLVFVVSCSQPASLSRLTDEGDLDDFGAGFNLTLLDEELAIPANEVVLTIGNRLNPQYTNRAGVIKNFHANVLKIANAKFVGYSLARAATETKGETSFAWQPDLKVFLARYQRNITAKWRPSGETPDHPDFAYIDSRAAASALKFVQPNSATDSTKSLKILVARARKSFDGENYQYVPSIVLLFIDSKTGETRTYSYANPLDNGTNFALYRLAVTPHSEPIVPAENAEPFLKNVDETMLINTLTSADSMRGVGQGIPPVLDVPFHTFVSGSARPMADGYNAETAPYGNPVLPAESLPAELVEQSPELIRILQELITTAGAEIAVEGSAITISASEFDLLSALVPKL